MLFGAKDTGVGNREEDTRTAWTLDMFSDTENLLKIQCGAEKQAKFTISDGVAVLGTIVGDK